ncbi:hypothetical protein ACLOJK_010395 [Asimina triloba]
MDGYEEDVPLPFSYSEVDNNTSINAASKPSTSAIYVSAVREEMHCNLHSPHNTEKQQHTPNSHLSYIMWKRVPPANRSDIGQQYSLQQQLAQLHCRTKKESEKERKNRVRTHVGSVSFDPSPFGNAEGAQFKLFRIAIANETLDLKTPLRSLPPPPQLCSSSAYFHCLGFWGLNGNRSQRYRRRCGGGGGGEFVRRGGLLVIPAVRPLIALPRKGCFVVYLPQGHLEQSDGYHPSLVYELRPHVVCRVTDVKLHVGSSSPSSCERKKFERNADAFLLGGFLQLGFWFWVTCVLSSPVFFQWDAKSRPCFLNSCYSVPAEAATDEVYAQVSLLPESEPIEKKLLDGEIQGDCEEEENDVPGKSATPHMFCKTLTASDTSTHGGFSVPRRAAEDCFPPLDYKQQRPSQELVARDLHGMEWRFRHIYRGRPRRHLLTTGWSAFVNKKKLVSGDAVLFLRGENGDLRLGIRRAAQLKSGASYSAFSSQKMNFGSIAAVANAISSKSAFHIYYNPSGTCVLRRVLSLMGGVLRNNAGIEEGVSPSEFIIPYRKFSKSLDHSFSIGMRFKMRFETEDAAERRYTGLVTGINDLDPVRWPGSKWRCLSVRWDDDIDHSRKNRVSPWEIEPSGSFSGSGSSSAPGSKRTKHGPSVEGDFPLSNGSGFSDFGESLRFQKVLQGQEILGFRAPYDGIDVSSHQKSNVRRCILDPNSSQVTGITTGVRILEGNPDTSYKGIGFGESIRFHKVLQGQEIFPLKPPFRGAQVDNRAQESGGLGIFDGVHVSSAGSRWPAMMQGYSSSMPSSIPATQVSSPSSVLMFQQANTQVHDPYTACDMNSQKRSEERSFSLLEGSDALKLRPLSLLHGPHYMGEKLNDHSIGTNHLEAVRMPILVNRADSHIKQGAIPTSNTSCRLFGFSLTKEIPTANQEDLTPASPSSAGDLNLETPLWHSNQNAWGNAERLPHSISQGLAKTVGRRCTKVHKQGSVVGRAIDLSKLDGYEDLICELERLFNMEGLLNDPDKGWQVVYTDDEDDMMLVGDDPWQEFCKIVSKILIYTQDEVVMMGPGSSGDDNRSCSEEAPAVIDVS